RIASTGSSFVFRSSRLDPCINAPVFRAPDHDLNVLATLVIPNASTSPADTDQIRGMRDWNAYRTTYQVSPIRHTSSIGGIWLNCNMGFLYQTGMFVPPGSRPSTLEDGGFWPAGCGRGGAIRGTCRPWK